MAEIDPPELGDISYEQLRHAAQTIEIKEEQPPQQDDYVGLEDIENLDFGNPEDLEAEDFWYGPYADDDVNFDELELESFRTSRRRQVQKLDKDAGDDINSFLAGININDDDSDDSDMDYIGYGNQSRPRDSMPSDPNEETAIRVEEAMGQIYDLNEKVDNITSQLEKLEKYIKRIPTVLRKVNELNGRLDILLGAQEPKKNQNPSKPPKKSNRGNVTREEIEEAERQSLFETFGITTPEDSRASDQPATDSSKQS